LRGTNHPESAFPNTTNRNTVAAIPFPRAQDPGHNAAGVVSISERAPKAAATNRGNLGLKDTIRSGLNHEWRAEFRFAVQAIVYHLLSPASLLKLRRAQRRRHLEEPQFDAPVVFDRRSVRD
jgi:hypothetical protein